ncbi:protein TolR [Montanilutibacter psychrotolerans]|uniref:Tol-Pal system protein TolR n=1 Tax=Montanilutibacter psychrotolerans TaxID=1327343 RepID=A0A3M8SZ90_9GAMM|nr:protein TolR [Lysobacter psychrotolerans]RNF84220.1 protein TolR [Lysobacter psychrotolerans]
MAAISGRRIRKRKLKADINVVPYIDVMLVLLVIFMVTAPLLSLGVDVDLPKQNARSIDVKKDPVVVSVDKDGNYFLAVEAGRNEAVTSQMLVARVRAIAEQDPELRVYVAGEGQASYQRVLDAMGMLGRAGVAKVGLMTQPETGGK